MARRPIEHRGRMLMEFDLDAALACKPACCWSTNTPIPMRHRQPPSQALAGCRGAAGRRDRHLDHAERPASREPRRRDLAITGVRQRETVPDSALSRADEIELIDITPSELRQRMAEGKVYLPETARLAADNFFKPENLTALRELALRRAAQTVDDQLVRR
jgi:two-component system sensor histidine kinase KdpD